MYIDGAAIHSAAYARFAAVLATERRHAGARLFGSRPQALVSAEKGKGRFKDARRHRGFFPAETICQQQRQMEAP
jgi:hypothetical protein